MQEEATTKHTKHTKENDSINKPTELFRLRHETSPMITTPRTTDRGAMGPLGDWKSTKT